MPKNDEKSNQVKQPNAVQRYFNETTGELRKVNWPTRREATNLTLIVLAVVVVVGMYLGLADTLFSRLMALLFA